MSMINIKNRWLRESVSESRPNFVSFFSAEQYRVFKLLWSKPFTRHYTLRKIITVKLEIFSVLWFGTSLVKWEILRTWLNKQIVPSSAVAQVILPLITSSSFDEGSTINTSSNNPRVTDMGNFRRTSWVEPTVVNQYVSNWLGWQNEGSQVFFLAIEQPKMRSLITTINYRESANIKSTKSVFHLMKSRLYLPQ